MPVSADRVLQLAKALKGFAPHEELSLADYLKAIPRLESLADVPSGTTVLVRGDVGYALACQIPSEQFLQYIVDCEHIMRSLQIQ